MAFPVVVSVASGTVTSNSTSWTLTYPADISSGDLILGFVGTDGTPTPTWPTGWNAVGAGVWNAPGSAARLIIYRKRADGTESGNFTLSLSAGEQGAWRLIVVRGAHPTTEPEVAGTAATGTSTAPDPPSLDPAGWATEDTLWWAVEAADHGNTDATAFPLPDGQFSDSSGGAPGAHLGSCRQALAQASLDPGTFTIDLSEDWVAQTLAVRPAPEARHATRRLRRAVGSPPPTPEAGVAAWGKPAPVVAPPSNNMTVIRPRQAEQAWFA